MMNFRFKRIRQGKLNKQNIFILYIFICVLGNNQSIFANNDNRVEVKLEESSNEEYIQWPKQGSTNTGGWIETAWHLLHPYNQLCPMDTSENERSQVGCVALAMAQIVNYYKYLPNLKFNEDDLYTTLQGIAIGEDNTNFDFASFDSLNRYLDIIREKYRKNIELDATEIAALNFACGISIKMNYTYAEGSYPKYGGWMDSIASSFKAKMGYFSAENISFVTNKTDRLDTLLIQNIINGLPVIMILPGHAIIADGYRSNGSFHFNFGYGNKKPAPITDMWWTIDELVKKRGEIRACILNINPNQPDVDPRLITSNSQVYFFNSEIGKSTVKAGKISNPSEHSIYVDHIISSKYFDHSLPEVAFPITLDPGQELSFDIKFTPDISGPIEGKLQVFASCGDVKKYLAIDLYGECIKGHPISPGHVSGVWKKEDSPYYIMGDISVPAGKKLIIEPGIEIIFKGAYEFTIEENAQLVAKGTEKDSIYFTASDKITGWQGLVFANSGIDDTLSYCVFSYGNRNRSVSNRGGVISIIESSTIISHSKIAHNNSSRHGGGIYLDNSAASISQTIFEKNKCTQYGGALYIINRSFTSIKDVKMLHNSSSSGGAISLSGNCFLRIDNVTIKNNYASLYGGGIYCNNSEITLINASIHHNSAGLDGGGIYFNHNSYLYFENDKRCNIYLNNAFRGKDLYNGNSNNIPAISVIVDTFTVLVPTNTLAYSTDQFTFDVLNEIADITLDINISNDQMPIKFSLNQNYPNPFNASTKIQFAIPIAATVLIDVYNILGQKVATVLNEYKNAGNHEIEFNAQTLSSGTYLYRIQADHFSEVRKMVIVR